MKFGQTASSKKSEIETYKDQAFPYSFVNLYTVTDKVSLEADARKIMLLRASSNSGRVIFC